MGWFLVLKARVGNPVTVPVIVEIDQRMSGAVHEA
jgi:hypothetical protein